MNFVHKVLYTIIDDQCTIICVCVFTIGWAWKIDNLTGVIKHWISLSATNLIHSVSKSFTYQRCAHLFFAWQISTKCCVKTCINVQKVWIRPWTRQKSKNTLKLPAWAIFLLSFSSTTYAFVFSIYFLRHIHEGTGVDWRQSAGEQVVSAQLRHYEIKIRYFDYS